MSNSKRKMTKAEAGQLGGLKNVENNGIDHMRDIGRLGAKAYHDRYGLKPIGANDFVIVDKITSKIMPKTLCGLSIEEYGLQPGVLYV